MDGSFHGKEYVLLGRTNGTAFIDISDPVDPVYLGNLNTNTVSSLWRDIKVYNNHAFIVSEAGGHGMQVFDLTRLRNVNNPPVNFTSDAVYTGFGNAHNIVINEATGTRLRGGHQHRLWRIAHREHCQTRESNHPRHVLTRRIHPRRPSRELHRPDPQYQGKEIAFACNENTITIVDVTDPTDATLISTEGYSGVAYTTKVGSPRTTNTSWWAMSSTSKISA